MTHTAYSLNKEFIEELRRRIQTLVESASPTTIFGSLFHGGVLLPDLDHLLQLIDAAVWASFTTEEGNAVTVSITYGGVEDSHDTFRFDTPIQFAVKNLVKLGAALENPRADIGVSADADNNLQIWGFKPRSTNNLVANLRVEAMGPGRILITYGGKSMAALIGNEAVFIDHSQLISLVVPKLSSPVAGSNDKMLRLMRYQSLLNTARKMRNHARGGTLLVVPEASDWQHSIEERVLYTGGANFLDRDFDLAQKPSLVSTVTDFFGAIIKNKTVNERENLRKMGEGVEQQCRHIARLTAVDGALVMSFDRFVYCFGVKITAPASETAIGRVKVLYPVEGDVGREVGIMDLGGTRHQSAAAFAHAQPGSVVIVVSQDGDVTMMTADGQSGAIVAVQRAELAVIPEGLGAVLWSYSRFAEMDML